MKTPPRAARPRSPRRTGHFLERRAGRGSWPATPRLEVGVRSNGADASVARRRDDRFVPMQEAAAAQKRAAAEKLYVVHECTNQCAQVGFYNY